MVDCRYTSLEKCIKVNIPAFCVPDHEWKNLLSDLTLSMARAPTELRGLFNKNKLHSSLTEASLKRYVRFWNDLLTFVFEYVMNDDVNDDGIFKYASMLKAFQRFETIVGNQYTQIW